MPVLPEIVMCPALVFTPAELSRIAEGPFMRRILKEGRILFALYDADDSQEPARKMTMTEDDDLLCALLRGEPRSSRLPSEVADRLAALGRRQGVSLLLYDRLKTTPDWGGWSAETRQRWEREVAVAATRDLLRTRELRGVLEALAAAGVRPLLIKGAALAHQIYPAPALRARQDADLLIREPDRETATRVLAARGYREPELDRSVSAQPLTGTHQSSHLLRDPHGLVHAIDLHWRISDTPLFAGLLSFEELAAAAEPIPALGPTALGLGPVHALLLACLHRIHHAHEPDRGDTTPNYGGDRLIWLWDIHLLAERLTDAEWSWFQTLSAEKRLGAVCRDGLRAARERFATDLPPAARADLTAPENPDDIPLTWLAGSHGQRLLTDLRTLPDWRLRAARLREILFPPADYMLGRYGTGRRWLLPLLYLHRALAGWRKYRR